MTTNEQWWGLQLAEARRLNNEELVRHASVSLRHRCRCRQCFCCAAVEVLAEREQADE